jgi:hypothetical protein
MPTIYEKTPGALIPTGERTLATFESGLIRVDRSYICRNEMADLLRVNELSVGSALPYDSAVEAVDGLLIFPEVQSVRRPDGFTEFKVSAYGRAKTGFTDERSFGELEVITVNENPNITIPEKQLYTQYIVRRFVKKADEELDLGLSNITEIFYYYDEYGRTYDPFVTVNNEGEVSQPFRLTSPTVRSFGEFDEYEVTIKPYLYIIYAAPD